MVSSSHFVTWPRSEEIYLKMAAFCVHDRCYIWDVCYHWCILHLLHLSCMIFTSTIWFCSGLPWRVERTISPVVRNLKLAKVEISTSWNFSVQFGQSIKTLQSTNYLYLFYICQYLILLHDDDDLIWYTIRYYLCCICIFEYICHYLMMMITCAVYTLYICIFVNISFLCMMMMITCAVYTGGGARLSGVMLSFGQAKLKLDVCLW